MPRRPVEILVVNAIEAEMLGAGAVTSLESALTAARALSGQFSSVVVTAGGDGVAYADRDGREHLIPPIRVKVASTHGRVTPSWESCQPNWPPELSCCQRSKPRTAPLPPSCQRQKPTGSNGHNLLVLRTWRGFTSTARRRQRTFRSA